MKRFPCVHLCAFLILLSSGLSAHAQNDAIAEQVNREIADGHILGAVVLVGQPGKTLYHEAFGQRDTDKPMPKDALFDVSSLTKPSALGTAMAILVHEGKLDLNATIDQVLPEVGGKGADQMTIRQLATHTSGLDNTKHLQRDLPHAELLGAILTRDVSREPGTAFDYSCLGTIRLSEMVAHLAEQPFGEFCQQRIFTPLGMTDTQFGPIRDASKRERTAASNHGRVGITQDPNARKVGKPVGNAGMFSTAPDLALLCTLWLQRGEFDGNRLFGEEVYETFVTNQSPPAVRARRGILWAVGGGGHVPAGLSQQTFWHTGHNGHSMFVDPISQSYVIVLTVWNHDAITASKGEGREARTRIADAAVRHTLDAQ